MPLSAEMAYRLIQSWCLFADDLLSFMGWYGKQLTGTVTVLHFVYNTHTNEHVVHALIASMLYRDNLLDMEIEEDDLIPAEPSSRRRHPGPLSTVALNAKRQIASCPPAEVFLFLISSLSKYNSLSQDAFHLSFDSIWHGIVSFSFRQSCGFSFTHMIFCTHPPDYCNINVSSASLL